MSRRDAVAVLVVVATLGYGGCSDDPAAPEASPAPYNLLEDCGPGGSAGSRPDAADQNGAETPVTISFAHGETGRRQDLLEQLVSEFEDAEPTIVVDVERVAGGRPGLFARWQAQPGDQRPSLALFSQEVTRRLADSRQTVAPAECLSEAVPGLLPAVEATWSVDGVAQAVPFGVSTPVLWYSVDAFQRAGLDPDDPPQNFDEMRHTAEELVASGTTSTGLLFSTSASAGGSWFVNQWNMQAGELSLKPANGHVPLGEEVTAAWADGPTASHLAWLQSMVADGLATSLGQGDGGGASFGPLFGVEEPTAGMVLYTSAALLELRDILGTGIGVAPLPGPGTGSLPGGTALWLTAGRPSAEEQAAWRLAEFLASPEVQARWAARGGYIPVTDDAPTHEPLASLWASEPQFSVPYEVLADQETSDVALGMSAGPQQLIDARLADAVDEILNGGDPSELLESAAADVDQLLDVYHRSR